MAWVARSYSYRERVDFELLLIGTIVAVIIIIIVIIYFYKRTWHIEFMVYLYGSQ